MGSMSGKTAVVTGGSRGIGRAICLELARRDANVVFSYAGNAAAAQQTLQELESLGVQARAVQGDVADPDAAKTLIDTAVKELGGIHILVNNAGITRDGLAMAMKEEDFDKVIQTNLKGAFLCMKAAIRPMMKARYRPHRQHELGGGPARQPRPDQLLRQQGRPDRHDQVPGQGDGRPRHHRQCGGPRLHLHRYDRRFARRCQAGHAVHHPGEPSPAPPRTWLPPWPSWPRRRQATSPARC